MAILHGDADITPTKPELLAAWLPAQPWFTGDAATLQHLGSFRFDDPDGEVGMETHLVRAGDGPTFQVPWTYRGAPIDGADAFLVGTMDHTVLGPRWVYDAIADPVYQSVLATTILTGGSQAELVREFADGRTEITEPAVRVTGSGSGSSATPVDLEIVRVLDGTPPDGDETLTGTWAEASEPVVLAVARLR
jgi:hypothetical protein